MAWARAGAPARGQGLDDLAVRGGVGDRRVAGRRLGVMDGALVGTADQGLLDAAVLIAEGYLEVEDPLAVALEAEMAGLDDARVHGADRHLVDLLALDPIEIHDSDRARAGPLEPVRSGGIGPA